MNKIEIVEEYKGHCGYVYIFAVKNVKAGHHFSYEKNRDKIIGIMFFDFTNGLRKALNKHLDPSIQFFSDPSDRTPDFFDEYGSNFYTKESVKAIINELQIILNDSEKQSEIRNNIAKALKQKAEFYAKTGRRDDCQLDIDEMLETKLDFYGRLIEKLKIILESAEDYEYILFEGP